MSSDQKEKVVHPYESEALTDGLNRFMNEQDFVGQQQSQFWINALHYFSAVSSHLLYLIHD